MSKLERLETFIAVVEENSFVRASVKLGISNAAVSKQVSCLEKDLGVQLLNRSSRQLTLTESGHLYYEHAKKLAEGIKDIDSLLSDLRKEPSGPLFVSCGRHFAECLIIPHLFEFNKSYPKIQLRLDVSERLHDLAREGIDINMGHSRVGGPHDIHRKIASTRYVICASPDYLAQNGTPLKPEDLYKHRYITHSSRDPDNVLLFKKGKELHLEPFMRINDTLIMKSCAIQGIGVVKMHHYAVADALKDGKLVEVLNGFDETIQNIYLCYQPTRYLQPKIRHFIDFFVAKISRENF